MRTKTFQYAVVIHGTPPTSCKHGDGPSQETDARLSIAGDSQGRGARVRRALSGCEARQAKGGDFVMRADAVVVAEPEAEKCRIAVRLMDATRSGGMTVQSRYTVRDGTHTHLVSRLGENAQARC